MFSPDQSVPGAEKKLPPKEILDGAKKMAERKITIGKDGTIITE